MKYKYKKKQRHKPKKPLCRVWPDILSKKKKKMEVNIQ